MQASVNTELCKRRKEIHGMTAEFSCEVAFEQDVMDTEFSRELASNRVLWSLVVNWLSNRMFWILSLVVNWLLNRMLWIPNCKTHHSNTS